MFFLVPTGTDAPIYHPPVVTAVLMGANVVMHVLQYLVPGFTEMLILNYGEIVPYRWLTAAYLHADPGHLIGNLMFLFIFGIIVEGKIGWWRFALIYNIIAIVASALITAVTYFLADGGGLGASCAIFGIMGMCFLWAPENTIHFKFFGIIFYRFYNSSFDVTVQNLGFFFIAMNLAIAAFTGFRISSEVAHLLGLLPGLLIGWAMIKARRVNCEGYDLFSIMSGKKGEVVLTIEEEAEQDRLKEERKEQRQEELAQGIKMISQYVDAGHYEVAFNRFSALAVSRPQLKLPETLLVKMINGAEQADDKEEPKQVRFRLKLMRYYLDNYTKLSSQIELKLIKHMLKNDQPRHALKMLDAIDQNRLPDRLKALIHKYSTFARQQIADGVMEVRMDEP
jgi:membrane associated rhomboid family serine protease